MKKILLIVLILNSYINFSQEINFDYINNSKPSIHNDLSTYFKNKISFKLLKNIKYPLKKNYTLNVFFNINEQNEIYNITTSFKVKKDLYDAIVNTFREYPIEKLNLDKIDSRKRYSFQIIGNTSEYGNIFYCSSIITSESLLVCAPCEDLKHYNDIKTCIRNNVKSYLLKNIDSTNIKLSNSKTPYLKLNLVINKKGNLNFEENKELEMYSDIISEFPLFKSPAKINNQATPYNLQILPFKQNSFNWFYSKLNPSSENDFSYFVENKLDKKFIKNSNLNRINDALVLSFELNKKNKPINIRTNARSYELNEEIIKIFNEYPIEKLDLRDRNLFSRYSTSVLFFNNNKTSIRTLNQFNVITPAIFKGCEKSKNIATLKNCASKKIKIHFAKRFDSYLPNKLKLKQGKKTIKIDFKIGLDGKVFDVNAVSDYPRLNKEAIKVMYRLAKTKPAEQNGKKVISTYRLPFSLNVLSIRSK